MTKIEICLTGIESALAAQAGGADRIELCDNLAQGGTTPSLGMMSQVRQRLHIAVHVMIRPRGGDFCYSEAEFAVMRQDVLAAKQSVDGVVLGILRPDGMIDKRRCRELIERARPLSVTFHRAFDMTPDPFATLDDLLELGVDRVLTSGQAATAVQGQSLIRQLYARAGEQLAIMAGGGITAQNAAALLAEAGISELHAGSSCTEWVPSRMIYQDSCLVMGNDRGESDYAVQQVTAQRVQELVTAIKSR